MIAILSCITVQHDLTLVLLAGLLCAFGSWVTARLYRHAQGRTKRQALLWQIWTAITAGVSIWSTHFVAMLGFRPEAPVAFDLGLTFISLVIAVFGSAIGIVLSATLRTRFAPLIGGAVLGLAIAAMHYAGMIAYRVQGIIFWDRAYLAASIILAVAFSAMALHLGAQTRRWSGERMAGVLTFAIVGLHFTGMTAFQVAPLAVSGDYVNPEALKVLALAIAGTASLIVVGGFFSYAVENRSRKESISELIEARNAAERASRAKSEFMSVLSHELRTPLTIVLGYADMLTNLRAHAPRDEEPVAPAEGRAEELGSQAELYGQRIMTAGNHLLGMINDILDYTSMELSDLKLSRTEFSFRDLLEEVETQYRVMAGEQSVAINIDCGELWVNADRNRCLQIVLNLAGNAMKFSGSRDIFLRARAESGSLVFEVEDLGRGIEPENLDRIFHAFQQLETADDREQGGTGLGLAICRSLAMAHGGDISVRSHLGTGTTFTVRLPDCAAEGLRPDLSFAA